MRYKSSKLLLLDQLPSSGRGKLGIKVCTIKLDMFSSTSFPGSFDSRSRQVIVTSSGRIWLQMNYISLIVNKNKTDK
jgi:hypothetical protein